MNQPSAAVAQANSARPAPADKLDALRARAAEARDLELAIADLEQQLKDRKSDLANLYYTVLPELMDAAETDAVGIPAKGNFPGMDFKMRPYYSASIAACCVNSAATYNALIRIRTKMTAQTAGDIHRLVYLHGGIPSGPGGSHVQ